MDNITDEQLLSGIAAGDMGAFEALYDRYARAAYSLAVRILRDGKAAEDVVQDSFLSIWRRASSYDSLRGSAKSWLLATVHHRAVDVYRKNRSGPIVHDVFDDRIAAGGEEEPWSAAVASLDAGVLREALAQLPPDQREAIEMAYFWGYSHREIAERCRLPLGTVKSRIRMGMSKLRERMKEEG